MSEAHALLEELRQLFPLDESKVEVFDELHARIAELRESASIRPLLQFLDDHCPLSGVVSSLAGSLERFPGDALARELLAELPDMRERSPFWAKDMVKRFLWRESDRLLLSEAERRASPLARAALSDILEAVRLEVDRLAPACDALLAELRR